MDTFLLELLIIVLFRLSDGEARVLEVKLKEMKHSTLMHHCIGSGFMTTKKKRKKRQTRRISQC